jgi:hypothetical protein
MVEPRDVEFEVEGGDCLRGWSTIWDHQCRADRDLRYAATNTGGVISIATCLSYRR